MGIALGSWIFVGFIRGVDYPVAWSLAIKPANIVNDVRNNFAEGLMIDGVRLDQAPDFVLKHKTASRRPPSTQ